MAKGNVFQGMARGKIGDVVLSRLNGQQISRVRNRQPHNPQTNPQLYQRAIMATIMRAYSAGKVIFDHSFEGKKVGSGCQAEFMALNAKALRAQIANEIAAGYDNTGTDVENLIARVCCRGVKFPVPNRYIISSGSLVNNIMDNNGAFINPPTDDPAGIAVGTWLQNNGFQPDTLLTLCVFIVSDTNDPNNVVGMASGNFGGKQYATYFYYVQLRPKAALFNDTTTKITEATTLSTVFDVASNHMPLNWATLTFTWGLAEAKFVSSEAALLGTSGVILSHENSGLRSNCTMSLYDDSTWDEQNYGLVTPEILGNWAMSTSTVGDSDLVLEGSGF